MSFARNPAECRKVYKYFFVVGKGPFNRSVVLKLGDIPVQPVNVIFGSGYKYHMEQCVYIELTQSRMV